jgi:hypothetical protein
MVLLSLQLPKPASTLRVVFGNGQTPVTMSELSTGGRRALYAPWCVHTSGDRQAVATLSRSLQDTLRYALAPAASWEWQRHLRRSRFTLRPDRRAKVALNY